MTYKVLRRNVSNEDVFARAVQLFALELQSYRDHMNNVAADPINFQAYPEPQALPDITSSVNPFTLQPDYEIVDFMSVEKGDIRALELRKDELFQQVKQMEAIAQHNLLPARKWRLAALEYTKAINTPEDARTPTDLSIIKDHGARISKLQNLQIHHARLESEIEDLNFDTINFWTPRPFGG